ncbi:ATP-binding protein [Megamonas sp.]
MKNLINRTQYLEQLKSFKDIQLIKVVSGIRRCGKSTLFDIYCDYLKQQGIDDSQIIRMNLESGEFYNIQDYRQLFSYVKERLCSDKMNYIFLDEVQNVKEFQKAVDSLFILNNCDVYITGSNAYLLSGELATLLSGRYVEIKMLPLSFKEYISSFPDKTDLIIKYNNYLLNSSFPYVLNLKSRKDILAYLDGIYSSILLKDIVSRHKIQDIEMLNSVIAYVFDNIGNLTSSTKIANTMTSAGKKISVKTVESYLNALSESFIIYKVGRYDVKGKQYLTTGFKYYIADIGLRYYLLGTKRADMGHILENVIYLELLRRGYRVYVGKVGTAEVDFVAVNENGTEYYQVAYSVIDENTLNRELASLDSIRDHNPKYLLTMDFVPPVSYNGIKQINALDWLLKN